MFQVFLLLARGGGKKELRKAKSVKQARTRTNHSSLLKIVYKNISTTGKSPNSPTISPSTTTPSLNIILMENQTPHLNALSRLLILSARNLKSRMRHPLGPVLVLRITLHTRAIVKALDQ